MIRSTLALRLLAPALALSACAVDTIVDDAEDPEALDPAPSLDGAWVGEAWRSDAGWIDFPYDINGDRFWRMRLDIDDHIGDLAITSLNPDVTLTPDEWTFYFFPTASDVLWEAEVQATSLNEGWLCELDEPELICTGEAYPITGLTFRRR